MCGIVGYIGKKQALPLVLDGLKALEYRGYDSAGVAVIEGKRVFSEKAVGRIVNLEARINARESSGFLGIAHTRWATHGGVSEVNAHPHHDCGRNIWLVHNGIIENYRELKSLLTKKGHAFTSETDTEVIVHLIEEIKNRKKSLSLEEAVRWATGELKGAYGLAIFDKREPEKLIAVRNFSPLVLGIGSGEYLAASDVSPILKHTKNVIYLEEGEMAVLTRNGYEISDFKSRLVKRPQTIIDWTIDEAKKGGFRHFMLKEIFEQPEAVRNTLRGRLLTGEGLARLGGLKQFEKTLRDLKRLLIVACGTAYFAGRVGEYMLEEYAGVPVEVDLASEFRYRKPVFRKGDGLLVISQSGETADTLAALREAKEKGIPAFGLVNVVGSTIARETDAGVYQHIGPEVGVASTKAFTSQVALLALLTLYLGRQREMSLVMGQRIAEELGRLPELLRQVLARAEEIKKLAHRYQKYNNFLYLGRKYNLPTALEGALKLKEISYVHAEGGSAGEMKHGPIAMIDEKFPSIFLALKDSVYEKTVSNLEEIQARGGKVLAVATEGDETIKDLADDVIYIPKTLEMLSPILAVVPLQLFAYYFAVKRGYDVDKPRNLAKSVTVE